MGNEVSTTAAPATVQQVLTANDALSLKKNLEDGFTSFRSVVDSQLSTVESRCVLQLSRKADNGEEPVLGFAVIDLQHRNVVGNRAKDGDSAVEARVHCFEVLPAHRRQGLCKPLLWHLQQWVADQGACCTLAVAPSEDGLEYARKYIMKGGCEAFAAWFVLHQDERAPVAGAPHAGAGVTAGHADPQPQEAESSSTEAFPYTWLPEEESARAAIARALNPCVDPSLPPGQAGIAYHARARNWDLQRLAQAYATWLKSELGYEDLHAQALALLAVDEMCGVTQGEEDEGEEGVQGAEEEDDAASQHELASLGDAAVQKPVADAKSDASEEAGPGARTATTPLPAGKGSPPLLRPHEGGGSGATYSGGGDPVTMAPVSEEQDRKRARLEL